MTENTEAPRRIVVGVDTSDNAAQAAAWAAREAAQRDLRLHLVHSLDQAIHIDPLVKPADYTAVRREAGQELLDRIAGGLRERHPDLDVTTEISDLDAATALVGLSEGAQFVVTGTRGHGGFAGLLLGSVSLKVAVHARCPAVVVRAGQAGDRLDQIVLGVEPDQDPAPIRFAFETAAEIGADVCAVRAWTPSAAYAGYYPVEAVDGREEAEEAEVEDLLAPVRKEFPGVEVSIHVLRAGAVPALSTVAAGSRLVVIGSHRRRGPLSVGAGYVVQGLLGHCPTPVAVVPIV